MRVRRAYSPSNYPYFYYNAPFFPTAELSSQQLQFYGNNARNQIPFNKASNLYYNIPYGYRGYENVRNDATLRQYHGKGRRNLRYYGFNKVVGGNKRTFHQDIKVKTKLGPIKNKGNISLESHSDVPEMINIPFKTSRARLVNKHPIKATTAKSTVQLKVQKSSWNEEKERVEKKNTTLTQGLNAGFIVPIAVRNTARKTLKSNTTHDTKVVNEIIDEISSDKLKSKNVSTAYDQITSHPILLGNKDHQTTYKRNTTTSHQSPHSEKKSANATTTSKTRSSTNHTVNAQTKNVLKNIKNGLQKTWQGIKNFTTYLTAPNKNKEKPPSKQPQLWKAPSIKHDAAKQDWFGIEVEPDAKTQNDLKISKSKFFTELVKTKMTEKPDQVAKSKDSKKDSENHVKKLVDLVEASEHEELKNIVQDSVGSPLKGELKRIPLSKENMKNVEKEKNAYIGATESNEINKLITNYKDDFDVFVDKSINKESDADSTQPKGEVLTAPRKLDTDVQFDNSLAFSNDVNEDVTGKRKNGFHNSNVGEDIPPDEVTSQLDELSSVAQKWQLIKEANKQIFDEGKKHLALEENQSKLDNSAESKDNINNETGESKVLNQYFSQIENKENVDQSKQFENKQNKRRQKINATLTMLSDIEHQIDGIIKDRGNSDESYMQNFQMPMKGRATIFQELVNGENSKEGVSAGAMEEDGNLVRPESEEELRNEDTDRSRSCKFVYNLFWILKGEACFRFCFLSIVCFFTEKILQNLTHSSFTLH